MTAIVMTKKSKAQRRWKILARALTSCSLSDDDDISVRRFASFGLLKTHLLDNLTDRGSTWYEYTGTIDNQQFSVRVRKINTNFTASDLIGFNNTGNVCVWPSEECLAFYLLRNRQICQNKRILELGGGMSCLAGVFAAKYCQPSTVTLTDGNVTSVENVRSIVATNCLSDFVRCAVVQWDKSAEALRQARDCSNRIKARTIEVADKSDGLYDVILCADCLFFDETRLDLVESIFGWLTESGIALVMAPKRGNTFQKFTEAATKRGFNVRQTEKYDSIVWSRHLDLLESNLDYCPDIHFPVLLELTKQNKMPPG